MQSCTHRTAWRYSVKPVGRHAFGRTTSDQLSQRCDIQQSAHMFDNRTRQPRTLSALTTPFDLVGIKTNRATDLMHCQPPLIALNRNYILQTFAKVIAVTIRHHPARGVQHLQIAGLARQYAEKPVWLAK